MKELFVFQLPDEPATRSRALVLRQNCGEFLVHYKTEGNAKEYDYYDGFYSDDIASVVLHMIDRLAPIAEYHNQEGSGSSALQILTAIGELRSFYSYILLP